MRFVLCTSPSEFAARVWPLLESRLECNLIATVLQSVLDSPRSSTGFVCAYGLGPSDEVQFAALRTPPWYMLASELAPDDAHGLVRQWLRVDPELPGVDSVPASSRAIAAAWGALTGGSTRRTLHEGMHALDEVCDPPWPAPGQLRLARPEDRPLLIEWMMAFSREAGLADHDQAARMVDTRLRRDGLLLWEDGAFVSMVGTAGPIAGVTRIGPVYTPPEHRRRGYAGTAVAAVSRRALTRGASRCMLFTDLSNPTSNKIYAEVGYRRVGDWEQYEFVSPHSPSNTSD